jgi:hypothetical protein
MCLFAWPLWSADTLQLHNDHGITVGRSMAMSMAMAMATKFEAILAARARLLRA